MKQLTYKRRHSLKNHRKQFFIHEQNDEKDYKTLIRKSFIYKLTTVETAGEENTRPDIFIRKEINHATKEEKFVFRVKGFFFLKNADSILKVEFAHALKIEIFWKTEIFSPKKSETLT